MLNRGVIFSSLLLVACLLLLSGCGNPPGKQALDGPADVTALYKARCINCHGAELQGKIGAKTNLQKVGQRLSAEDIVARIEQGGETMPAFKEQLSAEQIAGLAAWLAEKK
jgi:cytochrome c551